MESVSDLLDSCWKLLPFERVSFLTNFFKWYYILPVLCALVVTQILWVKLANYPPGPIAIPLVGNYFNLVGTNPFHFKLVEIQKRFGYVYSLKIRGHNVVFVHGHELIRECLVENKDVFVSRPNRVTGLNCTKGLTFGSGTECQNVRKFTLSALRDICVSRHGTEEKIMDGVHAVVEEFIESMEQPTKITPIIQKVVLKVLCDILLGKRYNSDDRQFLHMYESLLTLSSSKLTKFPENCLMYNPLLPASLQASAETRRVAAAEEMLRSILFTLIRDRRSGPGVRGAKDLIEHFLKKRQMKQDPNGFSDEMLVSVLADLLVQGFDTTSGCILWVFLFFLRCPDIQDTCKKEIIEKSGPGKPVSSRDQEGMTYLSATLKEVQRRTTQVPLSLPYLTETVVHVGGRTIPRNSVVVFHFQSAHMDQTYWKRPKEFRPRHFLDMDGKLAQHDAFFPHGIGPRLCAGETFSSTVVFMFVSNLLQRFRFLGPVGDKPPEPICDDTSTSRPKPYSICAIPQSV